MPVSYLSRRFLVSARRFSRARLLLLAWLRFSGRHRPRRVTFALHRAPLLVFSAPPAPSCGSLQRLGLSGHSSTAVQYTVTAQSLDLCQCGSLPQLGLLTSRKLSGILCQCVVLEPRVSLCSLGILSLRGPRPLCDT